MAQSRATHLDGRCIGPGATGSDRAATNVSTSSQPRSHLSQAINLTALDYVHSSNLQCILGEIVGMRQSRQACTRKKFAVAAFLNCSICSRSIPMMPTVSARSTRSFPPCDRGCVASMFGLSTFE